jgi:hypothetical protein
VLEWPYHPQYYIPVADARRNLLIPEDHTKQSRRGTSEAHTLRAGTVQRPGCSPTRRSLGWPVRFDWAALDAWFEEDEQVFVHPRNLYVRVDALRSTRGCTGAGNDDARTTQPDPPAHHGTLKASARICGWR